MVGQPGLTVTLSPRGATAIPDGKPTKALSMMTVAGVLAWITGRWWASETPFTEGVVPMTVSVATLAVLTVPAQLIGGRATRPWAMALAAASNGEAPSASWAATAAARVQPAPATWTPSPILGARSTSVRSSST